MIETPVKAPPPGGPPAAPPPDPRTRVMDPPPDPGARHDFACRHCGAPLHPDQAACLSCGAMVESSSERIGVRRAVVGSATALLVLGGAVGAAIAGLPHGKKVGKPPIAQVFGKKPATLPPATRSPGAGVAPITPLPGSTRATKPPKLHPSKPHPAKTHTTNTGSSTGTGTGTGSTKSPSKSGHKTHHGHKTRTTPPIATGPKLFDTGIQPAQAGRFDSTARDPSAATDRTIDNKANTSWATAQPNVGVWVQTNSPPHKHLGIVSETSGYAASVYVSNDKNPPKNIALWTKVWTTTSADARQRVPVGPGDNAQYYLVVIDNLPPGKSRVKINEIQLLP